MAWDEGLYPAQRDAAGHTGAHARMLAGPGTGKTHVLVRRIVFLLLDEEVPPDQIVALTFTRAAAGELRERVAAGLEEERGEVTPDDLPRISTLHSFALRQLLRNSERLDHLPQPVRIADDWEERHIIQEDLKETLDHDRISDTQELFQQLSADWQTQRADARDYTPNPAFIGAWRDHRDLYGYTLRNELIYQLKRALREYPALDLETPIEHLLVDEYQDLNPCDQAVVEALEVRGAEVFVAGDDDQSIYGFRMAAPEGIRRFTDEYDPAEDLPLELCFRCDPAILDLAHFVAELDPAREPKRLRSLQEREGGETTLLRFADQRMEAEGVADLCQTLVEAGHDPGEVLILLRSDRHNIFSGPVVDALRARGVPVAAGSSEEPLDTDAGQLVKAFLRLLADRSDHLAWRTIIQQRANGLGTAARRQMHAQADANNERFAETVRRIADDPDALARFGGAVRTEVEAVETLLERAEDYLGPGEDDPNGLIAAVEVLASDLVADDEAREKIVDQVLAVVQEAGASTPGDILRALAVSDVTMEQPVVPGRVNILTMHQAKGLTAETVVVAGAEDERLPGRAVDEGGMGDERRLLYVSLTRAKHRLFITYCNDRIGAQRRSGRVTHTTTRTLTRFLRDAPLYPKDGRTFVAGDAAELDYEGADSPHRDF